MKKLIVIALASALASPALNAAEGMKLFPADHGDLVVQTLVQDKSALSADIERAPVDFAWALDPNLELTKQAPYMAESREFWTTLDADAMKSGYDFLTTSPGALIRLSPLGEHAKSAPVKLHDLTIRIDDRAVTPEGIGVAADAVQMKLAGVDFGEGSLVFRLAPEAGAGLVNLQMKHASGSYLVHVFEPDSEIALTLSADRNQALAGQKVMLNAKLNAGNRSLSPNRIGGVATSQDGQSVDIEFVRAKGGTYEASLTLPNNANGGLSLWEIHTFAVAKHGGGNIVRDAKTSLAVAQPTARLLGDATTHQAKSNQMSVDLPVIVGSSGRYEVRGVMYGQNKDGSMRPFAIAHAARWLEPGTATISLDFGDLAAKSGLAAPYELRDLSLNDQSRLSTLETRQRALRIEK